MTTSKISIIIPCYNGKTFLKSSIESVLNQTYKNFVLFLLDNGSTDDSHKVMLHYKKKDKRVKVIKFKNKTSKAKGVNFAVKKCKTKFISILDADDLMFRKKIEIQLKYLKKNPKIDVLGTLCNYININDNESAGKSTQNLFKHNDCFHLIDQNRIIAIVAPSAIIKRDIFLKFNGFREEYWPADDADLWTRIAQMGFCVYTLPEVLLSYRVHKNSITTSNFFLSRLKSLWVKENLILRKKNKKEINYNHFLSKFNQKSIFFRIKEYLDALSDHWFRSSIIQIINKNYIKLTFILFLSFLSNPYRLIKKIAYRFFILNNLKKF